MPEKSDTWVQKKNHQKNSKKKFVYLKKVNQEVEKKLVLLINSVLEDILIYHLRLKENFLFFFFFEKKNFKKSTSVNFVGSDPRLLEIGAK